MEAELSRQQATGGHGHPSTATYLKVGLFLAVVTAIEIGIVYVKGLKGMLVPILFALAAVKFSTVAGFFMHLRFDNKLLTWVFAFGLFIALIFVLALSYMLRT